ncbi:MAG: hypothetical protein A2562_01285 [Candidatus Nealsonbacteria bacterium RIFOXYD1_FULL_39_11]|nr:MAG: hypothetical protein A2562_01285 [Candidatus Nealsonbacteria bacterium RIFOXYD1_FULL_39_11]
MDKELTIYCDGASRGNPGPASAAYVVMDGNEVISEDGHKLGVATNNVAEYQAILAAHNWLSQNSEILINFTNVKFILDSELATKQLNGLYKIKNQTLLLLVTKIKSLQKQISIPITFTHVKRHKNKRADALANQALDSTPAK